MAKLRTRTEGGEAIAEAVEAPARKRVRRVSKPQPPAPEATDRVMAPAITEPPITRKPRRKSAPRVPAEAVVQVDTVLVAEAPPEPEPDGFRGLLGQAVGIRLDGAGRTYRAGRVQVVALADVSLQIAPGEFVAVMGPSGCGKSTLLNLIGGLDRTTKGRVFAAGVPLDQLSGERVAEYRLQRVGSIFQSFNLLPELTASDNVALPLALAGVPVAERVVRVAKLLDLVGLSDRAGFRPGRLSGGEQQRIAVARALANRPGLILADEPTGSLDTESGERVLGLLEDAHRRGATVVLVTHDPAVAKRAERVVTMRDGRLLAGHESRKVEHAPVPLDPPGKLDRLEAVVLAAGRLARNPRGTLSTAAGLVSAVAAMTVLLSLSAALNDRFLGGFVMLATALAIAATTRSAARGRVQEMGVLRAVGAAAGALRVLYLSEAVLLGLVTGAGGVALAALIGIAGSHLPAALALRLGPSQALHLIHVTPQLALLGIGFGAVASPLGCLLPVLSAVRRDPARSLRAC